MTFLAAHRAGFTLSFALLVALHSLPAHGQPQSASESDVKAAFVYNFVRFIEWPSTRWTSAEAPYVVCLVGGTPLGPALHATLTDRTVQDRAFDIRELEPADPGVTVCHVVVVAPSAEDFDDVIAMAGQPGVLTVGEGRSFAERGGMIALTEVGGKIRFAINLRRTKQAELTVSSQLLGLADIVDDPTTETPP